MGNLVVAELVSRAWLIALCQASSPLKHAHTHHLATDTAHQRLQQMYQLVFSSTMLKKASGQSLGSQDYNT